MRRFFLYGGISAISVIVRMFFLPNPFECFGARAYLYNWIAEPILHIIAYALVGLVYCKGSFPAWGSFLYLITYAILVGVLWIFGIFNFAWWWILSLIVAIFVLTTGIPFVVKLIKRIYVKRRGLVKNSEN